MINKEKLKKTSIIAGLVLIAVICISAPLTLVFGKTTPTISYNDANVQQINQLRYDYIVATAEYKKAIGVVLKYKIESLPPGVASSDMTDLLNVLNK